MFIAFDGIDGSGKNTQVDILSKHLTDLNKKVTVMDFGGYSKFAPIIKQINKGQDKIPSVIRELLYYFEGLYANIEVIQQEKVDEFIIIDRYYLSYFAYGQLNGLTKDDIKFFTRHLIEPDLYFYIDIEPEKSFERITKYRNIDIPEIGFKHYKEAESKSLDKDMFLSFQRKVRQNYLSELKSNHIILDGEKDLDFLSEVIIYEVQKAW